MKFTALKLIQGLLAVLLALALPGVVQAQLPAHHGAVGAGADLTQWLMRLQDSPRGRAYVGTFVVNTGNQMSTSRIWHVCDGAQQIERIDALDGMPRSTFRHDDAVVTFLPDSRTVIQETRETLGLFTHLLQRSDTAVQKFYRLRPLGQARVAGLQTDVVELAPVDARRFGYRLWTERQSGLIVKLQTLDAGGGVLEQAAFSELQFATPLAFVQLQALMNDTRGYQVQSPRLRQTTLEQEGWRLHPRVPGFTPLRCYQQEDDGAPPPRPSLQCIFSDGLASVSIFMEPFDARRHKQLSAHEDLSMGATAMRVRQFDRWWLTAVGEVPPQTLSGFLQALERRP